MAVSGKGVTMGGKGARRISTSVRNGKYSQTGIRRELAAQRKAFGASGVSRAMKNWGLTAKKPASGRGKPTIKGRKNG